MHPIVKIIAVAGGSGSNTAMRHILTHLASNFSIPIIYLNSQHPADLAWLVQDASLPMKAAKWANDGDRIEAHNIYVCPFRCCCQVDSRERIRLFPTHQDDPTEPRINPFFQSIAAHYGRDACAVVLSGKGVDGIAGVLALRAKQGMVIVHEPNSALHPELPNAALATQVIETVLPTGAIAPFLSRLAGV